MVAAPRDRVRASILRTWTVLPMRRGLRASCWLILLLVLTPALARAQATRSTIPTFGLKQSQAPPEDDDPLTITETNVGLIDPALPLTMARLRFDGGWHNPRPVRAEYFQAKPGSLGGRGQHF